mgnify:FL=1
MISYLLMNELWLAFFGGTLLGLSVVGYLYIHGRIAGISGLIAQILNPHTLFKTPALWFVLGIFIVPFFFKNQLSDSIEFNASPMLMIIAGLLVGVGTRMGSGCTSGHGICGISRLSRRSIIATLCFMLTAGVTVFVMRHGFGVGA